MNNNGRYAPWQQKVPTLVVPSTNKKKTIIYGVPKSREERHIVI
jgi:hypothetical protein